MDMKFKRSRWIYSVAAFAMALSMLAGCSDKNTDTSEGEEGTISINVIGSEVDLPELDDEHVYMTDADGGYVTGVDGNVLTEPIVSETYAPIETLDSGDIMNAMTETTTKASLELTQISTSERYAYTTLTAEEKKLYDEIVSGVEGLRYKICDEDAYTLEEWAKIYGLVYNQEPRLFYMSSKNKVGKLFYLTKDAEAINKMQKDIDAVVDKLVQEAAGKSSTFEKLKVFHDYLVLNSTFELKDDANGNYNTTIYNAFGSGAAQGNIQCQGYAKAMQYLCDRSGIRSMVVTGETEAGQSHAWNVIDVDGAWYNLDCTWDDPILKTPNYKNLRYNYFLIPDKWIHDITHLHVSQKRLSSGGYITYFTPPACTETAQNYFVKSGLVYNDKASADAAIKAEIKRAAEDGSRTAQIMVGSKDVYDAIYNDRTSYNTYAKEFSGVKGVSDECRDYMLLIEFDVIYN